MQIKKIYNIFGLNIAVRSWSSGMMLAFQADGPGSIDAQWFMIHNSSENFGIPPVSRCFASEYPGERICCKLFFTSPPIGMMARKETV